MDVEQMKDTQREMIFKAVGGSALLPINGEAHNYCLDNNNDEVAVKDITTRDLKFHRAYFMFIHALYDVLPYSFRRKVSKDSFYLWLKHLQGRYKVIFEFKDGTRFVEYESISFGRMTQATFKNYVKEQMPFLYEDVLLPLLDDAAPAVWENLELEFDNYLNRL